MTILKSCSLLTSRSLSLVSSCCSRRIASSATVSSSSSLSAQFQAPPSIVPPIASPPTTQSTKASKMTGVDIEECHAAALRDGAITYDDPETGFRVFTELAHLKRGTCCGNQCRHCPYGFQNVRNKAVRRPAKLQSGDKATAAAMVKAILENGSTEGVVAPVKAPKSTDSDSDSDSYTSSDESSVASAEDKPVPKMAKTAASSASGGKTTTKNVPYTRRGDGGSSSLGTGERRSKDDSNFESIGCVDELCTFAGVVHAELVVDTDSEKYGELPTWLLDIMSRLFDIGSHLAKPRPPGTTEFDPNGIGGGFDGEHILVLESWINEMTEALPELTSFILPTGAKAAAQLHVCRTVCRRAERGMVKLVIDQQTCDPNALRYLNRLSDFFFVAARYVNYCEGQPEIQYQRESRGLKQRQRVARSLK